MKPFVTRIACCRPRPLVRLLPLHWPQRQLLLLPGLLQLYHRCQISYCVAEEALDPEVCSGVRKRF